MKKNKLIVILCLIFLLGISFFLRTYRLNQNIPNLYVDEVAGTYNTLYSPNTNSISQLDLSAKSLSGLSHFTWLFSFTPLGARSAAAFYGSFISLLVLLFSYAIAKKIYPTKSFAIAIISGLLAAVLPWSFMISRIGHSSVPIIVLLVCLHLITLINANNTLRYFLSLIPLGLSVLYYPSLVIIAPIGALLTFILMTSKFDLPKKRKWWLGFLVIFISMVVIGITRYQILNTKSRGFDLAIWRDINVTADSNYYRGLSRLSTPTIFSFNIDTETVANKLLFNYPISVINTFTKNYLSFFSPDFLFLKGDNILRHSTGTVGEFFPILLPFMIFGAFEFFKKVDTKLKAIFLVWILVSPIPAAITKDGATYLLRVITLMPFLTYFCSQGIVSSLGIFKKIYQKVIFGTFVVLLGIIATYNFLFSYFHVYPSLSASHWEYGFKEISEFQIQNPGKMLIIWEDKYPVWYFCFWQKLPGSTCDQNKMINSETVNSSRIDLPIPNLLFSLPQSKTDLNTIISKYNPKYLVIPIKYEMDFQDIEKNKKVLETIKYPDQTTAFTILKVNN